MQYEKEYSTKISFKNVMTSTVGLLVPKLYWYFQSKLLLNVESFLVCFRGFRPTRVFCSYIPRRHYYR